MAPARARIGAVIDRAMTTVIARMPSASATVAPRNQCSRLRTLLVTERSSLRSAVSSFCSSAAISARKRAWRSGCKDAISVEGDGPVPPSSRSVKAFVSANACQVRSVLMRASLVSVWWVSVLRRLKRSLISSVRWATRSPSARTRMASSVNRASVDTAMISATPVRRSASSRRSTWCVRSFR
jgi:hypothetical protein